MGIFPVWGFQMMIAIALSFVLRLNKLLVILASNVSIPPMIPFVIYLSHWCGAVWMGDRAQHISFDKELTKDSVMDNLVQYLAGAVTLSFVAGALGFVVTLLSLKAIRYARR